MPREMPDVIEGWVTTRTRPYDYGQKQPKFQITPFRGTLEELIKFHEVSLQDRRAAEDETWAKYHQDKIAELKAELGDET